MYRAWNNTHLKFPAIVVWRYTNGATADEAKTNCRHVFHKINYTRGGDVVTHRN